MASSRLCQNLGALNRRVNLLPSYTIKCFLIPVAPLSEPSDISSLLFETRNDAHDDTLQRYASGTGADASLVHSTAILKDLNGKQSPSTGHLADQ